MKIQCKCGAKYSFDVTPEMAAQPVKFVCPTCGLDSSDYVNELIRRELAPAAAPTQPRLSIARPQHAPPREAAAEPAPGEAQPCLKHPGQLAVERCRVCGRPICPKCMELFGYVCSPLCSAQAASRGIAIPVYAGQKSVKEAKQWRKIALLGGVVGALVVAALGLWFWYAWFGSQPHPVFSQPLADTAYAGASRLCGTNQLVVLHGTTLSRYDLKARRQVWSVNAIDPHQVEAQVDAIFNRIYAAEHQTRTPHVPPREIVEKQVAGGIERQLHLLVRGQNIWVAQPTRLVRYDWNTGKAEQEVPMTEDLVTPQQQDGALVFLGNTSTGTPAVVRVDLESGRMQAEPLGASAQKILAAEDAWARTQAGTAPAIPGQKPLNPQQIARQAQDMTYPQRIALPAVLANQMYNERINRELEEDDNDTSPRAPKPVASPPAERFSLAAGPYGNVEWSSRLLQKHFVSYQAAKPPPAKSALENNPSVGNTTAVANEMLNQMQHERGGDIVTENQSLYQVTVHQAGAPDWTGEVIGPPRVIPQKTVVTVLGDKTVIVLDKSNKKLWQTDMAYLIPRRTFESAAGDSVSVGAGPCVEQGNTLFVFDQTTLAAFDLATGNARWRLPTIGIIGLFFDGQGMLYVNSTTADLENVKYSRQIDISQSAPQALALKVDPADGRVLWRAQPGGFLSHVEGKYIYCFASHESDIDPNSTYALPGQMPTLMVIQRLDPATGKPLWGPDGYVQHRVPVNVRFDANRIALIFNNEVQVLKFLTL